MSSTVLTMGNRYHRAICKSMFLWDKPFVHRQYEAAVVVAPANPPRLCQVDYHHRPVPFHLNDPQTAILGELGQLEPGIGRFAAQGVKTLLQPRQHPGLT